ncbi:UbiA family prenyltransferase [Luteolibacter flavescens]|uniref:UbiA family prenyltransferase n=1 Tax=Luteolibacter flavescens TaxID=1859460 RepID=A0ABT3FVR0_9BACT|nr:UbiA family prenyltransferase [Luteolibacter flavescens]MCW1887655.1 UbiA family prenyltransferase [Luteolibacter flavescens]
MSRFRPLLATLRIANGPSVVSNVWLGYITSWYAFYGSWLPQDVEMIRWQSIALLCASGLLLYFSGNLANDWFDREWDRERRPERALPSGLFQPSSYLIAACLAMATGIACAFVENTYCGICAIIIAALVAIYTYFHKRVIWAVLPMGLCRAFLYALGFSAFLPTVVENFSSSGVTEFYIWIRIAFIATMATGMIAYIAGLSLSARYEGMGDAPPGPRRVSKALLFLPMLAMPCWFSIGKPHFALAGIIPYAAWLALCFTVFKKPIPRYVSALLAGIPLVDAAAAIPLALHLAFTPGNAVVNPSLAWTVIAVPLTAFILGRALQKLAPAT